MSTKPDQVQPPEDEDSSGLKVAVDQPYASADTKTIVHHHMNQASIDALLRMIGQR